MLMNILLWIILGGLAGWIASMLVKRGAGFGIIGYIVIGIVGAIVGGLLMNLIGVAGVTGFNLWSLLVAIIGAALLLFIVSAMRGRTA